jgi:hypothetical protein
LADGALWLSVGSELVTVSVPPLAKVGLGVEGDCGDKIGLATEALPCKIGWSAEFCRSTA